MGHEMEVMNEILKIDGVKEVMGTYGQYGPLQKYHPKQDLKLKK